MNITEQTNGAGFGPIKQTAPGVFEAPKAIVQNVHTARSIFLRLREDHLKRIKLYAEIEGLIQGNPPYNPRDLEAAGLDHVSNFNDMSADAQIGRVCLAYWNLSYNVKNFVKFTIRTKGLDKRFPNDTDPDAVHYAELMSEHWTAAVNERWPSFHINMATHSTQLVKLGISPIIWSDERDPRWRVIELAKFYIPDQTETDLALLNTVCVQTEVTIQYLWSVYQQFKNNPNSPWNTNELGVLLVLLTTAMPMSTLVAQDRYELARRLLAGDIGVDRYFSQTVQIVSMLQKEYDGKVSHYMFPVLQGVEVERNINSFLFAEQDQYESFEEALLIFTMNPGQFVIHLNKGMGQRIFSLAQAKLMAENRTVDMSNYSSIPILKSSSLSTRDLDQIKFYPGVPLNIGNYDLAQNNLGANIQGVVGVAQHLQQLMQYNITYSGNDPGQPDPDKGSLSPTDAKLKATNEFSVQKNFLTHYYKSLDLMVKNMTVKMINSKEGYPGYDIAELWKERCLDDGVPEYLLEPHDDERKRRIYMPKTLKVEATRVAGGGSQVAQLIGLQEMAPMISSLGPKGSRQYQRDFITATVGIEHVDEYMSDADESNEQTEGATIAGLENAVLQLGKSPIFSPDNDHRAHFAVHMALGMQIVKSIQQQQMDVIEADSVFNVLIPHTQEHLQALGQSMFTKDMYEKVKKSFNDLERYATFNHRNAVSALEAKIKKQQQDEQQTQQALSDEQRKNMQVVGDQRRADAKQEAQIARQDKASAVKEAQTIRKTDSDISATQKKAEGDVRARLLKAGGGGDQSSPDQQAEADPSGYLASITKNPIAPYDAGNS